MCKKQLTFERVAKLLLEVYFYRIVIYVIFSIAGYTTFSFSYLFWLLIPVKVVTNDFVSCYLVFLLFIPFLNILIQAMTEKMHILLIVLTVGIYTVMGTISSFKVTMNYVSWFIVLYFLAAYIRCYPKKVFSNCKLWGILTVVAVAISVISILLCARLYWESSGKSPYYPYYFLSDSNKLFALIVAMCSFLFFLNLPVKTNRFINVLGKTTFGVLMIHANSDTMRSWLWGDVLNNVSMYSSPLLIVHAVGSVIGIFAVCSVIDYLRIRFIEPVFLSMVNKLRSLQMGGIK